LHNDDDIRVMTAVKFVFKYVEPFLYSTSSLLHVIILSKQDPIIRPIQQTIEQINQPLGTHRLKSSPAMAPFSTHAALLTAFATHSPALLSHPSISPTAFEHGRPSPAPFLGRPFSGPSGLSTYSSLLEKSLTFDNMRFSDHVVDEAEKMVCVKGRRGLCGGGRGWGGRSVFAIGWGTVEEEGGDKGRVEGGSVGGLGGSGGAVSGFLIVWVFWSGAQRGFGGRWRRKAGTKGGWKVGV